MEGSCKSFHNKQSSPMASRRPAAPPQVFANPAFSSSYPGLGTYKRYTSWLILICLQIPNQYGCQNCDFSKVITIETRTAFQTTMEEAFSALHCPNCEEFRRLRDFSQGRPAVKLSEVGNREGPKNLRATNAKPLPA